MFIFKEDFIMQQPQQPMYQQYPQQPPSVPGKGMAIGSLVCGIVSLVFAWWSFAAIVGFIAGVVGIVLGVLGGKKMKMVGAPAGMATAGLVLSIIGAILSAIFFVVCGVCVACWANEIVNSTTNFTW